MTDSEQIVRRAYQVAEDMDMAAWSAAFTEDGTFTDMSIGVTWKGPRELPEQVENYHRAFPDIHRELYNVYVSGNMVVVQLALQGTHLGRQDDGHAVLRRIRARRRQDQALRLLPRRDHHPHPAGRAR
jgi:ketosteroid isomerase-like protein